MFSAWWLNSGRVLSTNGVKDTVPGSTIYLYRKRGSLREYVAISRGGDRCEAVVNEASAQNQKSSGD
jgi:hypothetical protein